jgi:hypothetical protein
MTVSVPGQYLDLHARGVVLPNAFVRPSSRRAIGWCGFQWVQLVESFGLHPFVDFFPVYRYGGGRSEAEADLRALNAEDSQRHLDAC